MRPNTVWPSRRIVVAIGEREHSKVLVSLQCKRGENYDDQDDYNDDYRYDLADTATRRADCQLGGSTMSFGGGGHSVLLCVELEF